jgi:hypothetical protein
MMAEGPSRPSAISCLEATPIRFVTAYLIGYSLLIIGALYALWYGGVLSRVSPGLILSALAVAGGLGVILWISTRKPRITPE